MIMCNIILYNDHIMMPLYVQFKMSRSGEYWGLKVQLYSDEDTMIIHGIIRQCRGV